MSNLKPNRLSKPIYHQYNDLLTDFSQLRDIDTGGFVDKSTTIIGQRPDGQWQIPVIKIGRNPNNRILILGGIHAREWISVEVPYLLAELLVKVANGKPVTGSNTHDSYYEQYKDKIKYLLQTREIWIVPMLNPEGNTFSHLKEHRDWKKNHRLLTYQRYSIKRGDTWEKLYQKFSIKKNYGFKDWNELSQVNQALVAKSRISITDKNTQLPTGLKIRLPIYGVDLNRNFPYQWDKPPSKLDELSYDNYPGPKPASEYEVQAVIKMFNQVETEGKPFKAAIDYHYKGELVFYPWGYKNSQTERQFVIGLGSYMTELINKVRFPNYPSQFKSLIPSASDKKNFAEMFKKVQDARRTFYIDMHAGVYALGGGMFLDWAHSNGKGMPVYVIELSPGPNVKGYQEPKVRIDVFKENLPAALALIEIGPIFPHLKKISTQTTTKNQWSNKRCYVCCIFTWTSSGNFSVAWMKKGKFVKQVAWGEKIDLVLKVNKPEQIKRDMQVSFEVFEKDILFDDPLKVFKVTLKKSYSHLTVPWQVGEVDSNRSAADAYDDWPAPPEFVFRVKIDGQTLESKEVSLIQTLSLTWEPPTRLFQNLLLIIFFQGMPLDLIFKGKFVISRAYGPAYDDYDDVKQIPFTKQKLPVSSDFFKIGNNLGCLLYLAKLSDFHKSEPEKYKKLYPFKKKNRPEWLRLNLTHEPRYKIYVELKIGNVALKAERKDLVLRSFENLFTEASAVPSLLAKHPHQDSVVQQEYRRHMVAIPDKVVNELRGKILAANNGSRNYDWWVTGKGSRDLKQLSRHITRKLRSQQEIEKQLQKFVKLASSNQQVSDFLKGTFNIEVEELNKYLENHYMNRAAQLKFKLKFTCPQKANTDVRLTIIGFAIIGVGRGEKRVEETIIWKKGTRETTTKEGYNAITLIKVQGKDIQGNIKVKVTVSTSPFHWLIYKNYTQLGQIKHNRVLLTYDIVDLNRILKTVKPGAILEFFSSSKEDIHGKLIIKRRAIIKKGKATFKKEIPPETIRLHGIQKVCTKPLTSDITETVMDITVTSIQYEGKNLKGLLRIKVREGYLPVFDINLATFNPIALNHALDASLPLIFTSSRIGDKGQLVIVGHKDKNPVKETFTLNSDIPVWTKHNYTKITSIQYKGKQGQQIRGTIKVVLPYKDEKLPPRIYLNIYERKIRDDSLSSLNKFLRETGSKLTIHSSAIIDKNKEVIVWGYNDQSLKKLVSDKVALGKKKSADNETKETFFKVVRVLWSKDLTGIISISGKRNGAYRTIWRNIFDEDVPPNVSKKKRGKKITMAVGKRAFHFQKLAEILRIYLGIDKEIWVFLYDETKGEETGLADHDENRNYHLIVFNLNHGQFTSRSTVKAIAHECKHAHQDDRISKLMGQTANLATLKSGRDTWDMRLVKAWRVNSLGGYFQAPKAPDKKDKKNYEKNKKNYEDQITEVDARSFEKRVFKGLIQGEF